MSALTIDQLKKLVDVQRFCLAPQTKPSYTKKQAVAPLERRGEADKGVERNVERVLTEAPGDTGPDYSIKIRKFDKLAGNKDDLNNHLFNERNVVAFVCDWRETPAAAYIPTPLIKKETFGGQFLGVEQEFAGLDIDDLFELLNCSEEGKKLAANVDFHRQLWRGVLKSLKQFHLIGMVHGDVKADNICVSFKARTVTVAKFQDGLDIDLDFETIQLIDLGCTLLPIANRMRSTQIIRAYDSSETDNAFVQRFAHIVEKQGKKGFYYYYPTEYKRLIIETLEQLKNTATAVDQTSYAINSIDFQHDLFALAACIKQHLPEQVTDSNVGELESAFTKKIIELPEFILTKLKLGEQLDLNSIYSAIDAQLVRTDMRQLNSFFVAYRPSAQPDTQTLSAAHPPQQSEQDYVSGVHIGTETGQASVIPHRPPNGIWRNLSLACAATTVLVAGVWYVVGQARSQQAALLTAENADIRAEYAEICPQTDSWGGVKRWFSSDAPCGWRKTPVVLACVAGNFEPYRCEKAQDRNVVARGIRACQDATAADGAEFAPAWNSFRLRSSALMQLHLGDVPNAKRTIDQALSLPNAGGANKETFVAAAQVYSVANETEKSLANLKSAKQYGLKYWDELKTARYFAPQSAVYKTPEFLALSKTLSDMPAGSKLRYIYLDSSNTSDCK